MAWRDDYRPGSFRGVRFYLRTSTSTGGRRVVLNEYPLRDEPDTEDLGRKARQFRLVMTVQGPDYMAQRDRLIAALETAGPGTLVHPFRGEMQVVPLDEYSCEESTQEGGLARISVTFVEAGVAPRPDSEAAQGVRGNLAADAVQADAVAEFEEEFDVLGYASFVAEETIDILQDAAQSILDAGGITGGAGDLGLLFRRLSGSFQALILAPGSLAGGLLGMVRSLTSGAGNPLQALKAQLSLFGLSGRVKAVSSSGTLVPARQQLQANQTAIYTLIERAAVTEAVRLAVTKPAAGGVDYDNRDQAVDIRDQILDEIDRQQLAASAARYPILAGLAADLVAEMNRTAASLVPLARVTPPVTLPALLLAHQLYGNATLADDVVKRNRIAHPGFLPGGVELEVLKNA